MKKKLQITMAAIALTAMTQATFAAETSRTLVPLADPLDQIQGNIKQARERAAKDLEEARKAWRRLVRENHPDALVARGLPQEAIKMAEKRMIDINRAWETISGKHA